MAEAGRSQGSNVFGVNWSAAFLRLLVDIQDPMDRGTAALNPSRYNTNMGRRGITLVLALGILGLAQDYDGPAPPKPDVPYLLHAHNLVETETAEARVEERKNAEAHILDGASSPVRTPLAEPIFLFRSEEIAVNSISLWRVEVVKGTREIAFPNDPKRRMRRGPFPVHFSVKPLGEDLYWMEANQYLDNGEYCLSPEGSQKVFCFQVY